MASYNTSDFKRGLKVQIDGDPYLMIECNFVKPGKGNALYKCKLRNLVRGTQLDRTYKGGDSLEAADVEEIDVPPGLIVVVNKADGDHLTEARKAARELAGAIRLIYPRDTLWRPPVLTMSALEGTGLEELWETVERHRQVLSEAGEFEARRRAQQVDWTWQMVRDTVLDRVLSNPAVRKVRAEVERQVLAGELTPAMAAQQILKVASS